MSIEPRPIKSTKCPYCDKELDQSTPIDPVERGPQKGDYSICAYCYGVSIFDNDPPEMRFPTEEEMDRLKECKRDWEAIQKLPRAHRLN